MNLAARLNRRITRLALGRQLPRRTVRVRLTLLYGGLFLLSGAVLLATTYALFERATEYTKPHLPKVPRAPAIQHLQQKPQLPQIAYAAGNEVVQPQQLPQALSRLAQDQYQLAQDRHLFLVHPRGRGAYQLAGDLPRLAQDQNQLARDQHQLAQAVHQLAQAMHQIGRAGSVEAAQRAADSHQLLVNSGIALAVVAVLALLAGWLIAGRMLRPIRTITRTAQRISSTSLHERLALDGPPDELKELGDTLDDLFARLDAAFEAQRQFVANASHELRAPLARQRALIQVALADPDANFTSLRAAHERVLASEQHLEQIIDGLLALTRGQAGLERREPLDLAALAAQALRMRDSETTNLDLDVRATLAPAPAAGDPRLVERLITNLIDNAIRHNIPQGHVEITTGTRHQHAFLTVTNSGPTIPRQEVPRLLQPFQRLHGTRTTHCSSNGLGLAIVNAIAAAHRATLSTQPRPGGGLTVEVIFPSTSLDGKQSNGTAPRPALEASRGAQTTA